MRSETEIEMQKKMGKGRKRDALATVAGGFPLTISPPREEPNGTAPRPQQHAAFWSNFQPMVLNGGSKHDNSGNGGKRPQTVPAQLPSGARKSILNPNRRHQTPEEHRRPPMSKPGTAGSHAYGSGSMPNTFRSSSGIDSRGSMVSSTESLGSHSKDYALITPPDTPPIESTFSSERRPLYSSGSIPTTFRGLDTRESQMGPPPTPIYAGDVVLPRGLSRHLLHFSYQRFPYGDVAHAAATTMQRSIRTYQQYKRAQMIKVQSTVRAWKARQLTRERKETYEAALTVILRNARVFLAKLTVLWMKHARAARAAQKIQSLHRGNKGRKDAREWRIFVRNRGALWIQKHWHAACGRARWNARFRWKRQQLHAATLIESYWRGYHYGRLLVYQIKLWSTMEIQRCLRGWLGRVKAVRQVLFRAATDIQRTLSRGVQGRIRAKTVYRARVEHEKDRREKEDRTIRNAIDRAISNMQQKMDEGGPDMKKELVRAKKELRRRDKERHVKTRKMSVKDQQRRAVEKVFRSFDVDGQSATIPMTRLEDLLKALCIPMTRKETNKVLLILKSPKRPGDMTNDAVVAASVQDTTPTCIRFEDFWELLGMELGGASVSSIVSEGELSATAIKRLRVKLQVTRSFRYWIGVNFKARARRWLMEEARKNAVKRARTTFRTSLSQRPSFCCDCCLRPFVFDYEISRHKEAMDNNCEQFDLYDRLRKVAFEKEKVRKEEALVLLRAKGHEFKMFEEFRRPGLKEVEM